MLAQWFYRGRSQKGDNGLCLPGRKTLQPVPVCHWCPSSCCLGAGAQREWVWVGESICGFFKWNYLGFQQFLPPTQSLLLFVARSSGDLSSWHWNPRLGCLVWSWDFLLLRYASQIFIHQSGRETCPFCIWAPPTSLDGCGFFNPIVVRLPFNSIPDSSEWWLFYILIVILMWLCEEWSHICLPCHLDQKPKLVYILLIWT